MATRLRHVKLYHPFPYDCLSEQYDTIDGKTHGIYQRWSNNGQLRRLDHYDNGVLHGESKEWTVYGQLIKHFNYHSDGLHGFQQRWYDNGQLKYTCHANHRVFLQSSSWEENGDKHQDKYMDSNGVLMICVDYCGPIIA